jgi:hypothetical protein
VDLQAPEPTPNLVLDVTSKTASVRTAQVASRSTTDLTSTPTADETTDATSDAASSLESRPGSVPLIQSSLIVRKQERTYLDQVLPERPVLQNPVECTLQGTGLDESDTTDDEVTLAHGLAPYSNLKAGWGQIPPSQRIRRPRRKNRNYGLMSLSLPVPLMRDNNLNDESRFIAELYVRLFSSFSINSRSLMGR